MVFTQSRRDPLTKRLVILRHGRTTWNAERRFQGQEDPPLDAVGIEQAKRAADILNHISYAKIVSSDLQRAKVTAQLIAQQAKLPIIEDVGLRETNCGSWQGRTWPEIYAEDAETLTAWSTSGDIRPGQTGETRSEVAQRFVAAVNHHAAELELGQTLLLVTHGGAARAGISELLGLPRDNWGALGVLSNCAWSVLTQQADSAQVWRLDEYNAGSLPEPAIGDDA
jgi:glucosyl-3-phosphoglycerate phosphatase